MLVKNITGITQTYPFGDLVLTPGQTQEIDNSFMENSDFLTALTDTHTISVIKYEKDMVSNTVTISVGVPYTSPSEDQKAAMVMANTPTINNPFSTWNDATVDHVGAILDTGTTIKTQAILSRCMTIGGYKELIDPAISVDISTQVAINVAGLETASIIPTSTLFYLYVSNRKATLGAKLLRPSLVAPTFLHDGYYLNANLDWKFVAYGQTPITTCLDILSPLFYITDYSITGLTGVQAAVLATTYEKITGTTVSALLAPRDFVQVSIIAPFQSSIGDELITVRCLGTTRIDRIISIDENMYTSFITRYSNHTDDIEYKDINVEMYGVGTTHSCNRSGINMFVSRGY